MDYLRRTAKLVNRGSRATVPVRRNFSRTGTIVKDDNPASNRGHKYYRFGFCLFSIILCAPVQAEGIGGISATASPTATSSGSVSNQAVQILQGTAVTNSYGGQIQCQGPTLTTTGYANRAKSFGRPYEPFYWDPVYDLSDLDDDGLLDNPGDVLFFKKTRTGQKDNHNWNVGLSIQATIPLDGGLQERCKTAVDTQLKLQQQVLANRRLDFEVSRLKHCGELMLKGIRFAPKSPFAKVCADVKINYPTPHTHPISVVPAAASFAAKQTQP